MHLQDAHFKDWCYGWWRKQHDFLGVSHTPNLNNCTRWICKSAISTPQSTFSSDAQLHCEHVLKRFQPCGPFNYSDPFHGPVGPWIQSNDFIKKVLSHQICEKLLWGFFLHRCSQLSHAEAWDLGEKEEGWWWWWWKKKTNAKTSYIIHSSNTNLYRINKKIKGNKSYCWPMGGKIQLSLRQLLSHDVIKVWFPKLLRCSSNSVQIKRYHKFSFCCRTADEIHHNRSSVLLNTTILFISQNTKIHH